MSVRGYQLGVDWFGLNDPGNIGEDDTSDITQDDITATWGRESTQAAAPLAAQQFDFVLNNRSRKYSPENGSSPLSGFILPNRGVHWQHTDTTGATAVFFDGILDTFNADSTSQQFTGSCLDNWGRPGDTQISTAVYSGIRTGDAVNIILDAIGWPAGPTARDIDAGSTCMPWWWEEGTDAATAISKLCDSEGPPAIAYVRGGVFVFEDRFHRLLTPASQTSQGLYTNISPAGSGPGGDFKMLRESITYDHGLLRIINSVTFTADERAVQPAVEVWSTDSPTWIDPGATVTFFVTSSDPFVNAVAPVEGAGIDSDTGVVVATISRTSGASTILQITSAVGSLVSRLALTAQPVTVVRSTKVVSSDMSSIGRYGIKSWDANRSPVWANKYDAQAIADRIVAGYAVNRPLLTFTVQVLDPTYVTQIHNRAISDRIHIRDDYLGVDDDFFVEKIKHVAHLLDPQQHQMTLTCEVPDPVQPTDRVFTFDVSGQGFNDGLFGVTGADNAATVFLFDPPDLNVMSINAGFLGGPDTTPLFSTSGCTFVLAGPGPFVGSFAQLTVVGSPTLAKARAPDSLPIVGGALYRIACLAYGGGGTVPNVQMGVDWFDASHNFISSGSTAGFNALASGIFIASSPLTAPNNAAFGQIGPAIFSSPAAGTTIFVADIRFARVANCFDQGVFGT